MKTDSGPFFTVFFMLGVAFSLSCSTSTKNENASAKFNQYYNQGEQLYLKYCSNCHQKDGTGLGRLYPPLQKSDYMDQHFEEVVCLMRYGKSGEIIVNGVQFQQPMPPIPQLTDLEIAEIATYIYNTWDHGKGLIEVKEVAPILQRCPNQSARLN